MFLYRHGVISNVCTLKRKAAEIRKSQRITDGGPPVDKKLTDLVLRILDILGETFYKGSGVQDHGVGEGAVPWVQCTLEHF